MSHGCCDMNQSLQNSQTLGQSFELLYLMGPALGWFKLGLLTLSLPTWVHHWDLFHTKLESNFGPFDPVGEAEAEIETLVMAEGSCSTTYFVEFNHLASCIQWGDHALLRQAYKGLACCIKNEMVHHNRPVTLQDLHKLVQAIDHRYWERKAEVTCEANLTSRVDPVTHHAGVPGSGVQVGLGWARGSYRRGFSKRVAALTRLLHLGFQSQ